MSKSADAREMRRQFPDLRPFQIARALGMDPSHVYDALNRQCLPRTRKPKPPRKMPLPQREVCAHLPFELAEAVAKEAWRLQCSQADVVRGALRVWFAAAAKMQSEYAEAAE